MRPLRIRAEGFSAYREPVELDLEGVEFFSLTGATGSGKSSVIDAMVFALYGRVPRLGGNAVAPAISSGADRLRVAFDFEVDGSRYTVGRMATRTKAGGATVKEARLEGSGRVIADGADHVTASVEDLLKLRFEDFTRTVVLPQGEFARFLTAGKAERQALLRHLLGLDLYTRVRSLAKTRAAVATEMVASAQQALDSLSRPAPGVVEADQKRLAELEALSGQIVDREKALMGLERTVSESEAEAERLTDALTRLDSIEPPDQLDELDRLAAEAREGVMSMEAQVEAIRAEISRVDGEIAELPSSKHREAQRGLHAELSDVTAKAAAHDLETHGAHLATATSNFEEASTRLDQTRSLLAQARDSHTAHALASALVVGEPCPVCHHEVEAIPDTEVPPELGDLEAGEKSVRKQLADARADMDGARDRLNRAEATRQEQLDQVSRLERSVAQIPSPQELDRLEGLEQDLTKQRRKRQTELEDAGRSLVAAQNQLEDLADAARRVDMQLTSAQLEVADMNPPVSEADDVVVRWKDLLAWRDAIRAETNLALSEARDVVKSSVSEATMYREQLVASLTSLGVAAKEPHAVQVAAELERARNTVADHRRVIAEIERLEAEVKEGAGVVAVAETLADHLRADGFERWLMTGAVAELVDGANGLLDQLSTGRYALDSDDSGSFSIIDHIDAGEMRSVSTLSGGETFLVSIALALSLAETLASAGGAELGTIILDEGFGTLSEGLLETVGDVLDELVAKGLTVGVITHVRELADRAPHRFEVTREQTRSKVAVVS